MYLLAKRSHPVIHLPQELFEAPNEDIAAHILQLQRGALHELLGDPVGLRVNLKSFFLGTLSTWLVTAKEVKDWAREEPRGIAINKLKKKNKIK